MHKEHNIQPGASEALHHCWVVLFLRTICYNQLNWQGICDQAKVTVWPLEY